MKEIIKTTILGLFFGTFGTTLRRNTGNYNKQKIKQVFKFYIIISIRTNDVCYMF